MCGRAAQTRNVVAQAATVFGLDLTLPPEKDEDDGQNDSRKDVLQDHSSSSTTPTQYRWQDNFNLSPGMDAMVFYKDKDGTIRVDRKVWGLVNKHGTRTNPLQPGMGKHFEGLMFNARSDTLFEKPSFGRLLSMGRSCIVAFDGFFEWKAPLGGKGRKQPYFVRSRSRIEQKCEKTSYLLMAGLWNQVSTGWDYEPTLDTFTIVTTEVCSPLRWLHDRMPVCVWDEKLALQWLDGPTEGIHDLIEKSSRQTPDGFFDWYPVTTDMSSTKFRSSDALKPLPKEKSVKDYFVAINSGNTQPFSTRIEAKKYRDHVSQSNEHKSSTFGKTDGDVDIKKRTLSSPNQQSLKKRLKSHLSPKKSTPSPKSKGTIDAFLEPKIKKPY